MMMPRGRTSGSSSACPALPGNITRCSDLFTGTLSVVRDGHLGPDRLLEVPDIQRHSVEAARGITGRDLAKEAGIGEGTIYNALGKRPILARNAKLIAGALQRLEVDPGLARVELGASSVQLLPGGGGQPRGVEVDVALDHAHG